MSGQHTPGPWTFSRCDEYRDVRFYISQADNAPYTPYYSDVATLVAETVRSDLAAIQEANARLIAAAPELLDALKECVEVIESEGGTSQRYRNLIAKATASTTDAGVEG